MGFQGLLVDGNEKKQYIEASPQYKTINVYDENMQRLGSRENKSEKQAEGETQSERKANNQRSKADDEEGGTSSKETNKKKRGQAI